MTEDAGHPATEADVMDAITRAVCAAYALFPCGHWAYTTEADQVRVAVEHFGMLLASGGPGILADAPAPLCPTCPETPGQTTIILSGHESWRAMVYAVEGVA
jgi:hypothetical protein